MKESDKVPKESHKDEVLMSIDYGETNIGIAMGRSGITAPVKIIPGKNTQTAINEIARLIIENKIDKIIVGLPLDHEGKETRQSIDTRKFGKLLKIRTKKPLHYQNEHGTSKEALEQAIELGIPMKKRNMKDHIAATLILKHYYDEHTIS